MKTLLLASLSVFFLMSASCTDFFNSKKLEPDSDILNQEKAEALPFPDGYNPHQGTFNQEKMLANIGAYVLYPMTSQLRLNSEILLQNIQQNRIDQAQLTWKEAMLNYHFLDAAPIGPLTDPQLRLGEQIYSWPYMNLCGVDHEVLKAKNEKNLYQAPELFTLKGLAVLEYLLFDEVRGTECNPRNPRNQVVVEWTQEPDTIKKQDRLFYARIIAQDLVKKTRSLESFWDPQGYNFTYRLMSGRLNLTLKEAVNTLSDSMFNIEKVKDVKLGKPLGLYKDCLSENKKCPESIEHLWSHISLDAVEAQVKGFESVFLGRDQGHQHNGFGFDDFLISMNRQDVAESMQQNLDLFYASLKQVQTLGSMESQVLDMNAEACQNSTIENKLVPICSMFQDLRQITTKMKTEFLVALSLRAPPTYQGDND